MTVIAFVGKPRTGKTLTMTTFGYEDYKLRQHEIFANYWVKFSQHPKMDVYDMLNIPFTDLQRNPKTLLIQEADKIFDSWLRTEENRLLSSLTGQSGKRNLNIYYDTQFYTRIQKALRAVTDLKIEMSSYIDKHTKNPIAFEYSIQEQIDFDVFHETHHFILPINSIIHGMAISDYFKQYDSYEVTQPFITDNEGGD